VALETIFVALEMLLGIVGFSSGQVGFLSGQKWQQREEDEVLGSAGSPFTYLMGWPW
jgi:hypothetical protein